MQNAKREIPVLNTIKALTLDLDGTILRPNSILSDYTIKVLKLYIDMGIKIIIATGRSPESSEQFRSAIGAEGAMIYFNGAEVVEMPNKKILHIDFLSKEVNEYCINIARKKNIYLQMYVPNENTHLLLTEKYREESEAYYKHTGIKAIEKRFDDIFSTPSFLGSIKSMFLVDQSHHEEIKKELYEKFGDEINVYRSSPIYLEVLKKGITKGSALSHILSYYDFSQKEVIAFGDEENDLTLFSVAGFAVAPANAKEEAKNKADLVVSSNDEDGVAKFLESLLLNKK